MLPISVAELVTNKHFIASLKKFLIDKYILLIILSNWWKIKIDDNSREIDLCHKFIILAVLNFILICT